MFKERHISKLIFIIPLLFIILTASITTLVHIQQTDIKFKKDSQKLKESFLKKEEKRLNTIVDSINSYIKFKKATSINILKNKIKSRVDFAQDVLTKLYNKSAGIESTSSIQISLLSALGSVKSKDKGKYFIYGYENKDDRFLPENISDSLYSNLGYFNKEFQVRFNELLKNKNEGFIAHSEPYESNLEIKELSKLTYIKNFTDLNLIVGYSIYLEDFEEITKKEVLNRLNLMSIDKNSNIFTLNDNLRVIQSSQNENIISKTFKSIEFKKDVHLILEDYVKKSKVNLSKNEYIYHWKSLDHNNYRLYIFNYIESWDWVVSVSLDVKNINHSVENIIGQNKEEENIMIEDSIKMAIIFSLLASVLSYFVSLKINQIFNNYKNRIESQKNALRNINATLEVKVEEKTQELEILNDKLKKKFKEEVRKNRKKDQLLYSQSKMASMGEMIGNIAHQWRQPLSTISTIASGNSLKMDFGEVNEKDLKKDFNKIIDTTKHLSNTIEDFRNFFMEDKHIEKFDLIEIIEKNLSLISASMSNNYITVIENLNSVEISGLKNELLQAILNILNNARDVLLDIEEDKRFIVIDVFEDEKSANIVIKDSGGGVSAAIIDKIFDAHFTTKQKDLGTGIGLYMTSQIIKNHMNGSLSVKNEEFVVDEIVYLGASFKIVIPK